MSIRRRQPFRYTMSGTVLTVTELSYADQDAEAVEGRSVTFDAAELPSEFQVGENVLTLLVYGMSQFLQDRTASRPTEEKLEAMGEVFARLQAGEWKAARESSGPAEKKAAIDPFFAQGFAEYLQSKGKGVDVTTATVTLQGLDTEQRKAIRNHPEVKALVDAAKAKAQEAAAGIDLSSLLG